MLSNGSSITEVVSVTVLGVLIVFVVLIVLMLVLQLMKMFSAEDTPANTPNTEKEVKVNEAIVNADPCEEELIAVFAAAIAASLKTSTYNLKIKSYKRLPERGVK